MIAEIVVVAILSRIVGECQIFVVVGPVRSTNEAILFAAFNETFEGDVDPAILSRILLNRLLQYGHGFGVGGIVGQILGLLGVGL